MWVCCKCNQCTQLEKVDCTCGGEVFEEGNTFANKLWVKDELSCSSDTESQFFLCNVAGRNLNACSICGIDETWWSHPLNYWNCTAVLILYAKSA